MPFNLAKDDPGKKKFNLAKPEVAQAAPVEKRKSYSAVYVVIGFCVLAVAIWVFTQKPAEITKPVENKTRPVQDEAIIPNEKLAAGFEPGSAASAEIDSSLLARISAYLNSNPTAKIIVHGYASSEGSAALNDSLSNARAVNFKNQLIAKGIPAGRIEAVGKGIQDPVSTNDTPEGRKQNRRVEIILN